MGIANEPWVGEFLSNRAMSGQPTLQLWFTLKQASLIHNRLFADSHVQIQEPALIQMPIGSKAQTWRFQECACTPTTIRAQVGPSQRRHDALLQPTAPILRRCRSPLEQGGGIYNAGTLTLSNTILKGNSSISGDELSNVDTGTSTGPVNVVPRTTIITSIQPVNITYGTALANSQLHGSARWTVSGLSILVAGTFTYTSAAGTVLGAGDGQSVNVTFTPSDTTHYAAATAAVTVNVKEGNGTVVVTPTATAPAAAPAPTGAVASARTEADLLHDVHVDQVTALYKSLVGTAPATRSLQAWVAELDAGFALDRVARTIARSPESLQKMVRDIYRQYLRRAPTAPQLAPLLSLARRGRFDLVRANVLGSAAYFKQRAHSSNARFLAVLAADVLGQRSTARRATHSTHVRWEQLWLWVEANKTSSFSWCSSARRNQPE